MRLMMSSRVLWWLRELTFALDSFGTTKNLPYVEFLKKAIYEMMETGKIQKILKKWEVKDRSCNLEIQQGRPLSIEKTFTFFVVLFIGVFLALLIMVMEKLIPNKQKKLKASSALVKFKALLKDIQEDLDKNINPDFDSLTNLQESSEELKSCV